MAVQPFTVFQTSALHGAVPVPGDKSISHRALILSALALGESRIRGLLESDDVLATLRALTQLGATFERQGDVWHVRGVGVGGLREPEEVLDLGNAGTGVRLLMGVAASHPFVTFFTGDASLRNRPMDRIIRPLEQMGARFIGHRGATLPLAVQGASEPLPITYESPVPSAQLKSAILLAGLNTPGATTVIERQATRDHTERLLAHFGVPVTSTANDHGGQNITVTGYGELRGREVLVPADFSSAAFFAVAALLIPGSELTLANVGVNPLRAGLLVTLQEMGADITLDNQRLEAGEPIADLKVRASALEGVRVPAARAPSMIDEYPILAVAAACAKGESRLEGLAELRVKESDRLSAIARGLAACGIDCEIQGDDLIIQGVGGMPDGGATIDTQLDHRIAMAFAVMGLASKNAITIDDSRMISTSFPGFLPLLRGLGATVTALDAHPETTPPAATESPA